MKKVHNANAYYNFNTLFIVEKKTTALMVVIHCIKYYIHTYILEYKNEKRREKFHHSRRMKMKMLRFFFESKKKDFVHLHQ